MKQFFRFVIAAALVLCLVYAAALADAPVSVQLDGELITFTDAVPRIVNDRTFLPLRAVFEAMGAEVGYDKGVITAVRGDRTLVMTVGSEEFTVTENGVTETMTMDVAPFIDPELSRTFVPVRFAAQAMGANVGWDAEERTVIIVDTDKLIDAALKDLSFDMFENLMKLSAGLEEGIWNSVSELKCDITFTDPELSDAPVTAFISSVCDGVELDGTQFRLNGNIRADLGALIEALYETSDGADEEVSDVEVAGEDDAETQRMLAVLAENGIDFSLRGDLASGKICFTADCTELGGDLGAFLNGSIWFSADLPTIMSYLGSEYPAIPAEDFDVKQIIDTFFDYCYLNDAESDYDYVVEIVGEIIDLFSDNGFTADGDVYTKTVEHSEEGLDIKILISETLRDGAASAFTSDFELIVNPSVKDLNELYYDLVDTDSADETADPYAVSIKGSVSIDDQGNTSATVTMINGDVYIADLSFESVRTRGTEAPETEPPAGAAVIDVLALLAMMIA